MKEVETPAICEKVLPNTWIAGTAMKSQVQKDKGKRKKGSEQKTTVEGHHVIMTSQRRKLILPDTSPSSEIDARSKNHVTKAIPKTSKLKSYKGKEPKAKALRKGKVVELL